MAPSDMRFKQRTVIEFEFLVSENVKPVDIYRRLLVAYGNKILDVKVLFVFEHYALMVLKLERLLLLIRIEMEGQ